MEKENLTNSEIVGGDNHTFVLKNRTVYTKSIRKGAGINMGFAFFGRKLQCQSASAPGGGDRERFLILLYNLWEFCLLLLHAVQDDCSWSKEKGGRSIAKKEVCGGSVFDKTTKRGSISGGGKRGVLGNTSIIMASSGKRNEGKGGGEARRVGEVSSFSRVCHLLHCSLDLVDIFETSF